MAVTIIFESHGTTLDNEAKLSSGHFDVELSELGKRQAKELGERRGSEHFDAIFCSDLQRSYKTAEIAFESLNIPIIKDSRLSDVDYGKMTRAPSSEVERTRGDFVDQPFPDGESYVETTSYMREFLQDLLRDYDGRRVMIIGHRATQYGLEHLINKIPLKEVVVAPWAWQPGWEYKLEKL
jgi:broad specificity phosphatase PhoE